MLSYSPCRLTKNVNKHSEPLERLGREADRSPPFSAEVKNAWRYTSTPNTSSRHGA